MSSTLFWAPVPIPPTGYQLADSLKFVLRKRFGQENLYESEGGVVLNSAAMSYLEGLEDAGVEGVTDLIEAIKKHNTVRVYEEY